MKQNNQTIAAVLAFFSPTGALGVHDFWLKKYGKGFAHIAIASIYFVPDIFNLICDSNSCDNKNNILLILYFVRYLSAISVIWAIVEGVQLLRKKDNIKTIDQNPSQNTTTQDSSQPKDAQTPPKISELSNSIYPKAQNNYEAPSEQNQETTHSNQSDGDQYSRYLIAGLVGTFTGLGVFGVHDFIIGRKKQGIIHAIMGSMVIFAPFIMAPMMCDSGCDADSNRLFLSQFLFGLSVISIASVAISAVWAFIESIKILMMTKNLPRKEK